MLSIKSQKFKNILFFAVVFLPLLSFISIANGQQQGFTDITVVEAYNMINSPDQYPDLIILDVRTLTEYNSEHLHNSTHIPLDEIEARIDELEKYKDTEILVYCRSGSRSRPASEILVENNFMKVFNMLGGIIEWIDAEYPYWSSESEINGEDGEADITIGSSSIIFILTVFGTITLILIFYKKHKYFSK